MAIHCDMYSRFTIFVWYEIHIYIFCRLGRIISLVD